VLRLSSLLVGLRLSKLVLCELAVWEMRQRLIAQPSLGVGPSFYLALVHKAVEGIAQPHVESGIVGPTPRN
jgi:hypothetical protein